SLKGEECFGGLDLSGKRDLTALGLYFPRIKTALVEFWTPRDTLHDRARNDRVPYDSWVREKYLHAPKGSAIDYGFVSKRVAELAALFDIQSIAFDRYHMDYLEPELLDEGVTVPLVPHGQGFGKSAESGLWMPHSIELLEQLITEKEITILFNPCLRWNAANAVIEEDKSGNRVFSKRRSNGRIDGVVGLAMAVGAADGVVEDDGDIDGFFDDPIMVGI
ncbi:terminase TerL endonuclease subunit, partial [Serratia ureilytica]|uniref:terminase TerL endonuclease subunit n=2 Tax=Serratia TaxID=613 RepID=UPI003F821092